VRIIVTGGNSGVGKETAAALAAAGHQVLIAARDNDN
jgi:NAD(P)-dependent dehydrogenase (short-subunit alcohol dehydrogenase family)